MFGPQSNLKDEINKKEKKSNLEILNKKKLIIAISVLIIAVIAIILIIVIALKTKKEKKGKNQSDSTENDPIPKDNNYLGLINCVYLIDDNLTTTKILSEDFQNQDDNIDIYIEEKKDKYKKEYKFEEKKEYNITFKLKGKINMDYMFKNIDTLISVSMESSKNLEITSLKLPSPGDNIAYLELYNFFK